ncbi:MAG: subclass B1 metallo-beta-lactamase [Marinilabiliales bacterium]|nr:MAG: subclass B1 metallo-beta-lactamase [Marinilabiliales bacterium]
MIKQFALVTFIVFIISNNSFAQENNIIVIDNNIQLINLQDSIFIHISWQQSETFGRFPSNGLIIIKNGEALMVDTPMDNDKTKRLTNYLNDSLSVSLTKLIVCHYHDDCLGGLEYLQTLGIESIANYLTIAKCKEIGLPIPSIPFTDSLKFNFNGEPVECSFFGAGHTFDNIVVYLPNKEILFGGCLVKSSNSKGLGNTTDAVVNEWSQTINKIIKRFPEIKTVVPGHGGHGDKKLLYHTVDLVEFAKNKSNLTK